MTRAAPLALALALTFALAACGDGGDNDGSEETLTVFAAASLTSTFEQIADEFEAANEGVEVELGFGGSADLVAQITEGAPADVFASADTATMDTLVEAGLAGDEPQAFATNTLQILTPPDNPAGVESFEDLVRDHITLVVCAPEVPCGAATQSMAELLHLTLNPVSEEQAVTDVLAKVASGEADAGVVYRTDVAAAGARVHGVAFPESGRVVNTYPIATVADGDQPGLAAEFVTLVLGETGQRILGEAGFDRP